jgi:hypothetical protein
VDARHVAPWLIALTLTGCAARQLPDGEPAVIVNPDAKSRAELQAIVRTALHGAQVTLAADALTDSSILAIEHRAPARIDAPPATGRVLGLGEEFLLLRDGTQCVLKQQSSGLRWLLFDTECAAAATPQ